MNKKLIILCAGLFFLLNISPAKSEASDNIQDANEKLQFLQAHPDKCSICTIKFELWHDEDHDSECWHKISEKFKELIDSCQNAEKNGNHWSEMLGLNLPTIITITNKPENSIHGSLSISADDARLSIEGKIYHDETYNENDWKTTVHLLSAYASEDGILKGSPFFSSIIALTCEDDGLHGSLRLELNCQE